MSRFRCTLFVVISLACSGCSGSDTLIILLRDANAFEAEIADSLVGVVDDASAKSYLELQVPRYQKRLAKLKDRIDMWDKYADAEKKKIKMEVDKIADIAIKDKKDVNEAAFEKLSEAHELFRLLKESMSNSRRVMQEAGRIQAVVNKLGTKKLFEIQDSWKAAGRLDSPRMRRFPEGFSGQEVDAEKEWPYLYKMQDPFKEVHGGKGLFMK